MTPDPVSEWVISFGRSCDHALPATARADAEATMRELEASYPEIKQPPPSAFEKARALLDRLEAGRNG